MTIRDLLTAHKDAIIRKWMDAMYGTYPFDTVGFLRSSKDRFSNPVGHTTAASAVVIFDAVAGDDVEEACLSGAIEDVIRIRAIQNFTPEQAVGVLFVLKTVLRQMLRSDIIRHGLHDGQLAVESRIDTVALMAFGTYARCRERLHTMRVDECKHGCALLLRRAERILDKPAGEPDTHKPIA